MAIYSAYFDFSLDDAEQALDFINPNIDYQDWANIGRALAAEFGSAAEDIFHKWSEQSDSYKQSSVNSQWKSFQKSNSVNISTLIYHARQAGWTQDKKQTLSDDEKQRRTTERQEKQQQRQIKAEKVSARKQRLTAAWYSQIPELPFNKKANPYQIDKQLNDASQLSEHKEFHSKKRHLQVIPLRDINGDWRGAELIYAWRKSKDRKTGKLRHFKRLLSGSEPSLGFHVFPNHDALKTAKRVFIVEGWADGAWAHKATGEITAYVVGSHNVALIAALIEQKYPDCQVIVSPDNDKAGNTAIKNHNGFWSQPIALNDWSDVANQEGPESLKAQLLNIRGFKKCFIKEQYLGNGKNLKILPGMNLIKSEKETGKSTWIIEFLNKPENSNLSVLVISYRKNLINSLAKKAGVDYYEDLAELSNEQLRQSSRLAISPDSIYKLLYKGTLAHYDVVFIDECEQTLGHFQAKIMQHKEKNYGVMSWFLKHSKYQILADANLNTGTIEYCNDININRGQFIINEHKPRLNSEMNLYAHNMQLRNEFIARASIEPIFYCSNSKDRVLEVERLLLDSGIKSETIQAVHSGNSGTAEIKNFIVDINDHVKDLHVILASPSLGTGVSIDKGHPFKAVFAEFTHRTGSAEAAHQQMARARGITEYHVYLDTAVNNYPTDPDKIRKVMLDKPEKDAANLFTFDINQGEMVAKDELFEKLYCRNQAFINQNRNCFAYRFIQIAENEGYDIAKIALNKDAALETKIATLEIREQLEVELKERIFDNEKNPVLSVDEYELAKLGRIEVSEESRLKTQIVKTLNLAGILKFPTLVGKTHEQAMDEVNELALAEATSNYVTSIKNLSVLAQSKEVAILRDIEDRKFAESRAGLKHFTAQRRHELRFLKAIGIDENLDYNGKEWQSKDIKTQMANYLSKYKDEIQAYSGSNITNKTLKDPIRWFVNHLKAMSVPVVAYQKRVNGKQTWFRKVDEATWQQTKDLVNLRVRGLQKYYDKKQHEFMSSTVTQEATIYNDDNCLHVTPVLTPSPVNTPSLVTFEEPEKNQKDLSLETAVLNQSLNSNVNLFTDKPIEKRIFIDPEIETNKMFGTFINENDVKHIEDSIWCPKVFSDYVKHTLNIEVTEKSIRLVKQAASAAELTPLSKSNRYSLIMAWASLSQADINDINQGGFSYDSLVKYFKSLTVPYVETSLA